MSALLYLSQKDILSIGINPEMARDAVIDSFRDLGKNLNHSLPKQALHLAKGHAFQAMCAASQTDDVAMVKWLGMVPKSESAGSPSIHALICLSRLHTGEILAIMDGAALTLLRTAAMSSVAAYFLGPSAPRTIGFVGCGAQALSHLEALAKFYPTLIQVLAFSRSERSIGSVLKMASNMGLSAKRETSAESLVRQSDMVVTSVPDANGMQPFLEAQWLQPGSFVAAVDTARSWHDSSFGCFDIMATDSLSQGTHPYSREGTSLSRQFDTDLVTLVSNDLRLGNPELRTIFNFRGYALGDLALATLAYRAAAERKIGMLIPK